MASTVLPNGIIIPEKYSRDWYNDLYHNWEELDNLLAGGGANDGTLTIQKNGTTIGTFSANQATDETIDITVPDVNNGTLTIQKNGTDIGTFSANQATDETINIEVPDVNNGTLTIQKNGTDIGTFSANQATDETINITVPDVNDGTLTIQQNGTAVDTFTANSSSDKTVNIQCVDLTSNQTVGGIKTFSNAPVVGSINLDGKTIDTDVNGNMTYDGHIIDTIEEQGNGYIRYSNGLQICWTYNELVTQSSSGTWTYPKTFISIPCIWWQATGNNTVYIDAVNSGDRTPSNAVFIPSRYANGSVVAAPYGVIGLAIGRWK